MSELGAKLSTQLQDARTVRANQRYHTFHAMLDGQPVFVKQAVAPLANEIKSELWGLQTFRQLSETEELGFEVPHIVDFGNDYIITSWAEGAPLDFRSDASTFQDDIVFMANSLAIIDRITNLVNPPHAKLEMRSVDATASIDKLRKRLASTAYADHIDPLLVDRALKHLYNTCETLTARLTHADFTPANILDHEGKKTLIDYESVHWLWPRYYDLVNLTYNRMVLEPQLTSGCQQIVEGYFANGTADPESALPQMNTIAVFRALSLVWECLTEPNEHHNTQQFLTPELSTRLSTGLGQVLLGKPYFESLS